MIQKSILLHCSPKKAFELFTARVSEWWPKTHRPTKDPASELYLEQSGRFWERATDGREADLGRVQSWEPPHRLLLDFYLGTSAAQPTRVEVTFRPEGDSTRVHINHQPLPASQALWEQRAPTFDRSWDAVLAALVNR